MTLTLADEIIGIVGLGYVGLPLAVEFGKSRRVIGFDINEERISELQAGHDATLEVSATDLTEASHVSYTNQLADLAACGVFIVTVPTPIDRANRPDLGPLVEASRAVASVMRSGAVVIFESTVYPGCTRDVCVPILEAASGLTFNQEFFVGYSPERINPGDKDHRIHSITKVTSGSTQDVASAVDELYASIVTAGTHKASSIEVAEAAKVIENTQRDLNIALMNELSIIFDKLNLDSMEVLAAAGSKWNFLPFKPGLVGGHCIGVDPYYLTHRAQELGYHPEIVLAGRRVNDKMAQHLVDRVARLMMRRGFPVVGSRILVMGLSFKENCPDVRNSKVIDVIRGLEEYQAKVEVWDPWVNPDDARNAFDLSLVEDKPAPGRYDAVVMTVGHREFVALGAQEIRSFGHDNAVFFDVKAEFDKSESDGRL